MQRFAARIFAGLMFVLVLPLAAAAQTSAIAGEVKDTSGAVLPGVTVEVASPALIEKVRSAVSDGSGGIPSPACRPAPTRSPSACQDSTPSSVKAWNSPPTSPPR